MTIAQPKGPEESAAPLFDASYYNATRPDLVGSHADLLRHYVTFGWREGSQPHPLFDPGYAIWQAGAGWPADVEPFGYWQDGGWQLGTAPHPLFDMGRMRALVPHGDPLAGWAATGQSPHALFDRSYYLAQSPQVPPGMDPFAHYVLHGHAQGLAPHRLFDPSYYLAQRPDVVARKAEPLAHYVQFGWTEDTHPHPLIAPAYYRAQAGAVEPIAHYLAGEGVYAPHPLFDPALYQSGTGPFEGLPLLHYLDHPNPADPFWLVDEAGYRARTGVTGPALLHYLRQGWRDGHAPHPLFDSAGYGPTPPGLAPLLHYVTVGERQGRRPNPLFAPAFYCALNPGAVPNPFRHYVETGEAQHRAAAPEFRPRRYRSRFMVGQGGSPMRHALLHGHGVLAPMAGPVAPQIIGARGGSGPVGASIILLGPPDAEARRAQLAVLENHAVELPDLAALRDWAQTATGPVVLLSGAAFMAHADLHRLIATAPSHPVVLDRAGDVRSAGAGPRGAGADPLEPALNAVTTIRTAGPVLALPSPQALATLDPDQSLAGAFLTLSAAATLQPGAQATDLAATVGGPDAPPIAHDTPGSRPRVLFIESIVPRVSFDAGSYYALQLMTMYQGFGYDVTLVPDAELDADPALVRSVADRGIVVQQAPFAPSTAEYIAATPDEFAVIVMARHTSGGRFMEALRARWPTARLIFHPGDLHFLREARAAALSGESQAQETAARTQARELALVAGADCTVVVSQHEQALLVAEGLGAQVVQVDPEFANRPPAPYRAAQRAGVAFIGGYGHQPNVDAVHFLCTDIWPRITASRPDIVLHVVGSASPPEFAAYASANVVIHGRIEDLDAFLDTMRLTIAPLRYGAGVKMKLITSLAAGVPAVVTPVAAEGIGLDGAGFVVADDPDALASAVLALYDDTKRLGQLSAQAKRAVQNRFSARAVRARYKKAVGV